MKVTVFDTHKFDREALERANSGKHELHFIEARLTASTAALAKGADAVCCFANDRVDSDAIRKFKEFGITLIALRSAGYNHVDLKVAAECGIKVVRVPEYSPYAVAEHAVAMLQTFNRKIHKAHNRVREMNFSLDGLVGIDLHGKTVGVVGTGRIGKAFAQIMNGFGCKLLAYDVKPDLNWAEDLNLKYTDMNALLSQSDVISLHVPLRPETRHLLNSDAFSKMKNCAILVNTGRGGLIDSKALIKALKARTLAGACLDVYEEEEGIFFSDLSESGVSDDVLARLMTFPNVLITSHQAFLTHEALTNIADTTISNITAFESGSDLSEVEVSA